MSENPFKYVRYLLTAPSIFHVGVKERVSVQVGKGLLNKPVTCYLEQEVNRVLMSKRETIQITDEGKVGTLELQVNKMYFITLYFRRRF